MIDVKDIDDDFIIKHLREFAPQNRFGKCEKIKNPLGLIVQGEYNIHQKGEKTRRVRK